MITKNELERLSEFVWQVPQNYRADMRVPARIWADEELLDDALQDKSVEQLINTSTLPGIVKYAIAMPDIHQGYGAPVGGVFATAASDGVISPGAVGYDINCGVRVLASHVNAEEIQLYLQNLATTLYRNCPSGVGVSGSVELFGDDLENILNRGADWTLERGYARVEDLPRTEEYGRIPYADAAQVSHKATERGRDQLGTLGAGNHFIEVDRIAAIYDSDAAGVLDLFENQVVVQIHCGSRGLGHQVCQDYVDKFQRVVKEYNIVLPDRELVAAPYTSPEGKAYVGAMGAAANFAFANRQVLAFHIRRSFAEVLKGHVTDFDLHQVYDIAHNMAKIEDHDVGGASKQLLVHRKGATRAFGPDSPVLPADLKQIGQPVLIPGSMGTMSFILCGTAGSMAQTFGSCCHGAGRVWSRNRAKKEIRGEKLRAEMQEQGIQVRAGSLTGLAEEAPQAYKNVSRVVHVVDQAGIGKIVAKLVPLAVIKGQRMKLETVAIENAVGGVLIHNIADAEGHKALNKGHRLIESDVEKLRALGKTTVFVGKFQDGDVSENDAATRIANALTGKNVSQSPVSGGRVNLFADTRGILKIDTDALDRINSLDGITVATISTNQVVERKKMVATVKTIGLVISENTLRELEQITHDFGNVIGVRELKNARVAVILTGSAQARARVEKGLISPIYGRVEELGAKVISSEYVEHDERAIAAAVERAKNLQVDCVILAGETSIMDTSDVTPGGIVQAGGTIEVYGAPVEPGNLLLLAYANDLPIIGAPGCVKSRDINVVDLILPRLLAGERLRKQDIVALANGGLLI